MTGKTDAERMAALRAQLRRDKSDLLTELLLRRSSGARKQCDLPGNGPATGKNP
jgi:hypothetical protein